MVARTVLPYALTLALAGTVGVAAFQNQNPRPLPQNDPGRPTPPYVIVVNHGPNEAIPIAFTGRTVIGLEPGATVQTVSLPQAWLYRSVTIHPSDDAGAVLNAWGNDGWEAVGVTSSTQQSSVILMKRPRDAARDPARGGSR